MIHMCDISSEHKNWNFRHPLQISESTIFKLHFNHSTLHCMKTNTCMKNGTEENT